MTANLTSPNLLDLDQLPLSPAARWEVAMALLAPTCVDEDGNEYTGAPLIDAEAFLRIVGV